MVQFTYIYIIFGISSAKYANHDISYTGSIAGYFQKWLLGKGPLTAAFYGIL